MCTPAIRADHFNRSILVHLTGRATLKGTARGHHQDHDSEKTQAEQHLHRSQHPQD